MFNVDVSLIELHDSSTPFFTVTVFIREDPDTVPEPQPCREIKASVFIDRDESLSVQEIKKRAVRAAFDLLKAAADSQGAAGGSSS